MINDFLNGNKKFVAEEFLTHDDYYQSIAEHQSPKVLWIGCSDSRVSENVITGTRPGTLFVHRNVANIVAFNDVSIASILEYGFKHLKIEDIVVCGHTRCGGIEAIEKALKKIILQTGFVLLQAQKKQQIGLLKKKTFVGRKSWNY